MITKQYLKDYSMLLEEIEGEEERLKYLIGKAGGLSAMIGDGMPHSKSNQDKTATQACIAIDLKKRIAELNEEERDSRQKIEKALGEFVDIPQERRIIRLRYIDRMEWSEIQRILFEKRRDYYENEEKYRRLTFRIHGNALAKLNPKGKV